MASIVYSESMSESMAMKCYKSLIWILDPCTLVVMVQPVSEAPAVDTSREQP